jgi:hypothetical protein
MRVLPALLFFICMTCVAHSADHLDPELLKRALTAMQVQRNQALDVAADREAQLMVELAKAQAKIKELEAKPAPEK